MYFTLSDLEIRNAYHRWTVQRNLWFLHFPPSFIHNGFFSKVRFRISSSFKYRIFYCFFFMLIFLFLKSISGDWITVLIIIIKKNLSFYFICQFYKFSEWSPRAFETSSAKFRDATQVCLTLEMFSLVETTGRNGLLVFIIASFVFIWLGVFFLGFTTFQSCTICRISVFED